MRTLKTLATDIALVVAFRVISMDALAKKPVSSNPPNTETKTALSNKEALNLAKTYLPGFQEVDPEITLKHLKSYILSLNTTDPAEIDAAMQSYLLSLQSVPLNQAPTISGTPPTTVTVGESYSFTPTSSDADGDVLSFSILNPPAWASFDNQTGTLQGTPEAHDAGSYTEIEILVSDAKTSTSLVPFTLVVEALPTTGSTTLAWIPPSTRTDGTPLSLSEIDGYRIYMGDSETTLALVMDINDHSVTHYTLTNIVTGTYFFSVTVYDVDSNESGFSNIVEKSTL